MFPRSSRFANFVALAGWIALSLAAGGVGAIASTGARDFYAQLNRPAWAPPGWLFAPAWTTLYILMGIAAWLVWRERGRTGANPALGLFMAQLLLNALWTWIYFEWRAGALAFAEIVLLWATIIATLVAFWRMSRKAGLLLLPYLAWVSYASALTWWTWQRNPSALG